MNFIYGRHEGFQTAGQTDLDYTFGSFIGKWGRGVEKPRYIMERKVGKL